MSFHSVPFSVVYPGSGCVGSHLSLPLPGHLLQFIWGTAEAFPSQPRHYLSSVCFFYPGAFSQFGHAQKNLPRMGPGGILVRCPNRLNWLLSIWRSSGSNVSPSQITELLIFSIRESVRKFISTAISLFVLVTTQRS